MHLAYHRSHPNFGDALNPVLARHVFGDVFDADERERFLFIGTIIARTAPQGCRETILGAGAGYRSGPYSLERRDIYCVRGPLTCDLLGIDRTHAAIDPAILSSRFYDPGAAASAGCLFMPHHSTHSSAGAQLGALCGEAGMTYVSPFEDVEAIILKIGAASRVVTEALHGAVVAESFGVPWVPIVFSSQVLAKKWQDFSATIGTEYRPVEIHANIAFDGTVRWRDLVKHHASRIGLGKSKYRYLPVRKATPSALNALEGRLRELARGGEEPVRSRAAVRRESTARLQAAIDRFIETRVAAAPSGVEAASRPMS